MAVTRYLTVARIGEAETEVKRSRFLGTVERLRRQHRDARHHCSAFVFGPGGVFGTLLGASGPMTSPGSTPSSPS